MTFWFIIVFYFNLKFTFNLNFNTPFYLNSNDNFYQVRQSHSNEMKIITFNQSETTSFSMKFGKLVVKSFTISSVNSKYKVKLYSQLMNSFQFNNDKEIKIKLICKFFYPLLINSRNGDYNCIIYYKLNTDKPFTEKCKLEMSATSSFCVISISIQPNGLEKRDDIVFNATITHCVDPTCSTKFIEALAKSQLKVQLENQNMLIWMISYYNNDQKIGIILGMPRHTVPNDNNFDLPVKLTPSDMGRKICNLVIEIKLEPTIPYEILDDQGYFRLTKKMEEADTFIYFKNELCDPEEKDLSRTSEFIFCLRFNVKKIKDSFQITTFIHKISYEKDDQSFIHFSNRYTSNPLHIPVGEPGNLIVVPIIDRRLWPSSKEFRGPLLLTKEALEIYHLYDKSRSILTNEMECRPFNNSFLQCPSDLKANNNQVSSWIDNKESLDWSIEMKTTDLQIVLDVEPEFIFENVWEIMLEDQVLNKISGWSGPQKRYETELITNTTCGNLYQSYPFKIFRKASLYNEETEKRKILMIDISKHINLNDININTNVATIYRYGTSLIIQGLNKGAGVLELKHKDKILSSINVEVINELVDIKDINVSCVSTINVTSNLFQSFHFTNIYDIKFAYQPFNKFKDCFLIVDLIYSDGSLANIFTIQKEQLHIRFITSRKIIDVYDFNDMFYNHTTFRGETSFDIEIHESKFCNPSKRIIKKSIHLIPIKFPTNVNVTNPAIVTTPEGKQNDGYQLKFVGTSTFHKVIYILCPILALALIIVIIKILKDLVAKKRSRNLSSRRRNSCLNDNNRHDKLTCEKSYPPLLPSPGPQIGITDDITIAMTSPQSFWCINSNNTLTKKNSQPFSRQYSLPTKGCPLKESLTYGQQCIPLRWVDKILAEDSKMNIYTSHEALNNPPDLMPITGSQMCWSVTHMEGDHSSGIGSIVTNMDDLLKDPYEARDKFSRLSELPLINGDQNDKVYEPI